MPQEVSNINYQCNVHLMLSTESGDLCICTVEVLCKQHQKSEWFVSF